VTLERDDDARLAEEDAAEAGLSSTSAETADELDQMSDEEAAEAVEIRAEIEETRLEMGGTLNELGERLDPGTLMDQAKENVREATIGRVEETAKGMSDMVMETIKSNPIPAAMAGAGLALLWANRKSGNGNGHTFDRRYDAAYGSTYRRQDGQGIGDAASNVGDTARGAVGQVANTVGQVGENVGQTAGEIGQNVGQTVGQVGGQLDRFMHANPLAMGAIAIGAGAVIGSLIPETPQEREMLGDAGRQIGNTVRDTVEQATTKAEAAMDRTEEKVSAGA
jgi:ElaB/YqjD/DUF883 family membrane-anchored ribosome-binding protein